jgi:heme exporter protein C
LPNAGFGHGFPQTQGTTATDAASFDLKLRQKAAISVSMHKYANPTRFMRWAEASQPYLLALGILLGFGGMIWGLTVPPDEEMQELIKPLFVHVPSAGLSLIVYGSMSIAAFVALVWRHPLPEIFCLAAAPVGAVVTVVALITGALWGKPTLNTYWDWRDPRMVLELLLLFQYLIYIVLVRVLSQRDPALGRRVGSIFLVASVVTVLLSKFVTEWFLVLHQGSSGANVIQLTGRVVMNLLGQGEDVAAEPVEDDGIAGVYVPPLLITMLGTYLFYMAIGIWLMRYELIRMRLRSLRRKQAAAHSFLAEATGT